MGWLNSARRLGAGLINPLGNPKGTTVKQKANKVGRRRHLGIQLNFFPSPTLCWQTNGSALYPSQPVQVLIEMKPGFVKAIMSNILKWLVMAFEER